MAPKSTRKTKSQRYSLLELPEPGECLLFRFPSSLTFKHFVYDDFPEGRKIRADEAFVDFASPIYVEEVRTGEIMGKMFVAVAFMLDSGLTVWTNYSKEAFKYMVKVRASYVAMPLVNSASNGTEFVS